MKMLTQFMSGVMDTFAVWWKSDRIRIHAPESKIFFAEIGHRMMIDQRVFLVESQISGVEGDLARFQLELSELEAESTERWYLELATPLHGLEGRQRQGENRRKIINKGKEIQ